MDYPTPSWIYNDLPVKVTTLDLELWKNGNGR
jgi:hypothetical protein